MRFAFRWVANAISFYLALYLVDSLIAPRFWIKAVWVAVVLAVGLGLLNSMIRPLHRIRKRPWYATTIVIATLGLNTLVLQIFIWAGAPLSTTHPVWLLVTAAFLSLLAGVINWLVGFKTKEKPSVVSRGRGKTSSRPGRDARPADGGTTRTRKARAGSTAGSTPRIRARKSTRRRPAPRPERSEEQDSDERHPQE